MSELFAASRAHPQTEDATASRVSARPEADGANIAGDVIAPYLRAFPALASLLFVVSFLRGWRLPGQWSATHFTFNYSQGFIRRGLVGELLRQTHIPNVYHYTTFLALAWIIFAVTAVMLALLVRRACRAARYDVDLRCAVLVMGASLANVELTHLVGYLDFLGLIGEIVLILLAARAKSPYLMFAWVVPFGVVSTFVHEGMALLFGPTMLFAMACRIAAEHRNDATNRRALVLSACALGAMATIFAVSAVVGHYGTKPSAQILALQQVLAKQVDFGLRDDAFETLWRSAKENFEVLMPGFYRGMTSWRILMIAAVPMLPTQTFMFVYGLVAVRRLDVAPLVRWLLGALFVFASMAPLMMYFVGWDLARWHSWAIYGSFVSVCCMKILLPRAPGAANTVIAGPLLLAFGAAAIACDLSGSVGLFDGYQIQGFPFEGNFRFFVDQLKDGFPYRPPR